jgi:hypothetical protein
MLPSAIKPNATKRSFSTLLNGGRFGLGSSAGSPYRVVDVIFDDTV